MKKLKTLCAIIGAAAIIGMSVPVFAQQQFNVPDYNLKGAEEKVTYQAVTPFGVMPIDNPSEAEGFPVVTIKMYGVDRNKDGKADLLYTEINIDDIKFKMDDGSEMFVQKGYKAKQLAIDDDFDGYIERMLVDSYDKDGNLGSDGVYEEEQHAPRISDYFK